MIFLLVTFTIRYSSFFIKEATELISPSFEIKFLVTNSVDPPVSYEKTGSPQDRASELTVGNVSAYVRFKKT